MSERRKLLREVIYLAHEGGYDGPGADWDSAPAPELDRVLEKDEHVAVLRSERFSRPFFWQILHPETATLGAGGAEDEVDPEILEADEEEIEALGKELAASPDPLEFLKTYLS